MLKDEKLQPEGYFDFVVPPLETLWWMEGADCFDTKQPDKWRWTLMIMQAGYISGKTIGRAKDEISRKKEVAYLDKLRHEKDPAGKAAQIMHIGPYNEVGRAIDVMVKDFESKGFKQTGKHHEIYLSDPRRVPPERLKTIVRFYYE